MEESGERVNISGGGKKGSLVLYIVVDIVQSVHWLQKRREALGGRGSYRVRFEFRRQCVCECVCSTGWMDAGTGG